MTGTLEVVTTSADAFSQLFSEEDILRTNKEKQEALVACAYSAFYHFHEMTRPLLVGLQVFDVGADARRPDVLANDDVRSAQETVLVIALNHEERCAPKIPADRRVEPSLILSYSLDVYSDARIHLSTLLVVKAGATPVPLFVSGPRGYSTVAETSDTEGMLQDALSDLRSNMPDVLSTLDPYYSLSTDIQTV